MPTAPLALPAPLAWAASPDVLAWVVVSLFAGTVLLDIWNRARARSLAAVAWTTFGLFWLVLFPHFAFEQKSFVEGALSLAAVPACVYVAYLLYSGRESLFVVTRAVAFMGLVYLPFIEVPVLRRFLIETVTGQVEAMLRFAGYDFEVVAQSQYGYRGAFFFEHENGDTYHIDVLLACTGIGSMSIFGGLIAAVRAPLRRKLQALAVVVPVIWILNLIRVAFISVAFSQQWFQIFVDPIMGMVGYTNPHMVSFFVADRVLAQVLAVVAMVAIAWLVTRVLPELLGVAEELLYLLTGTEYDLHDAFDAERPVRADGVGRSDGGGR